MIFEYSSIRNELFNKLSFNDKLTLRLVSKHFYRSINVNSEKAKVFEEKIRIENEIKNLQLKIYDLDERIIRAYNFSTQKSELEIKEKNIIKKLNELKSSYSFFFKGLFNSSFNILQEKLNKYRSRMSKLIELSEYHPENLSLSELKDEESHLGNRLTILKDEQSKLDTICTRFITQKKMSNLLGEKKYYDALPILDIKNLNLLSNNFDPATMTAPIMKGTFENGLEFILIRSRNTYNNQITYGAIFEKPYKSFNSCELGSLGNIPLIDDVRKSIQNRKFSLLCFTPIVEVEHNIEIVEVEHNIE